MIVGKTLEEWIECYQSIIDEPGQIKRVKDYYEGKIDGLNRGKVIFSNHEIWHIGYRDGLIDRELMQGE